MGPVDTRGLAMLLMASQGQSLAECRDGQAIDWLVTRRLIESASREMTERGRQLARVMKQVAEFCVEHVQTPGT